MTKAPKFDYDDMLIVPAVNTDISSRYSDIELPEKLPLFTAPMDTVVDLNNAFSFIDNGVSVCLPRTISYRKIWREIFHLPDINFSKTKDYIVHYVDDVFVSVGLNEIDDLCDHYDPMLMNFRNILIDVANGHMKSILVACEKIKHTNPKIKIMVGNIANPEIYRWYGESGLVDYIRVGIGNGGGCLTTKQTGVGYPKASLIQETYEVKKSMFNRLKNPISKYKLPAIVADGGYKDYADIIKALALGADYVMLGSIYNKCIESCAPNYLYGVKIGQKLANKLFLSGYPIKKYFRGMSTKEAQKAMGKTSFKTSEGVVRYQKVEYTLNGWMENFKHYLRTAMSYSNAKKLDDFIGKAEICQITKNAYDRFNK